MLADAIQRCGHHSLFQWHLLQLQAFFRDFDAQISQNASFLLGILVGILSVKILPQIGVCHYVYVKNPNERRGTTRFGWTFFLFISSNKANSGCKVYVRPVYRGIYLPNPFGFNASSYVNLWLGDGVRIFGEKKVAVVREGTGQRRIWALYGCFLKWEISKSSVWRGSSIINHPAIGVSPCWETSINIIWVLKWGIPQTMAFNASWWSNDLDDFGIPPRLLGTPRWSTSTGLKPENSPSDARGRFWTCGRHTASQHQPVARKVQAWRV